MKYLVLKTYNEGTDFVDEDGEEWEVVEAGGLDSPVDVVKSSNFADYTDDCSFYVVKLVDVFNYFSKVGQDPDPSLTIINKGKAPFLR